MEDSVAAWRDQAQRVTPSASPKTLYRDTRKGRRNRPPFQLRSLTEIVSLFSLYLEGEALGLAKIVQQLVHISHSTGWYSYGPHT